MDNFQFPWLDESFKALLEDRSQIPSALLLRGRPAMGKTAFALRLSQAMLCEATVKSGTQSNVKSDIDSKQTRTLPPPCMTCASCQWFASGNHPDFRLLTPGSLRSGFQSAIGASFDSIDGEDEAGRNVEGAASDAGTDASSGGVEAGGGAKAESDAKSKEIRIGQVKALRGFLSIGSHRGGKRVVLIDPVETLNAESANALLKVLEEPGKDLHFILVARNSSGVLPTIVSRCQQMALPTPSQDAVLKWLVSEAATHGASLAPLEAARLLRRANAMPLLARQLAEPTQNAAYQAVLDGISQLPDTGVVETASALAEYSPALVLSVCQQWLLDLELVRQGLAPKCFPELAGRLRALVKRRDDVAKASQRLSDSLLALAQQTRLLRHPLNARLFLEENLQLTCAGIVD